MVALVTCLDTIAGCADCLAEEPFQRAGGHECDDMCRFFGDQKRDDPEFHRLSHRPTTCQHCGAVLDDHRGNDRIKARPCANGTCLVWYCPDCDGEWGSDGPLGCPVCSPVEDEDEAA